MNFYNKFFENPTLSHFYNFKRNHFNLIKFLLSIFVLHTHCYMFLDGNMLNDPLKKIFHIKWGDLGTTTLFFLISGFVLTESISRSRNIFCFIWNRFIKIFPSVFLAILITIIFAFCLSELKFTDFFLSAELKHFIFKNSILILDIKSRLVQSVFQNNPIPYVLNAQWWTLKWTIITYLVAFLFFYPLKLITSKIYFNLFFISFLVYINFVYSDKSSWMGTILSFFLAGVFFSYNKEKIPINIILAIFAFILYLLLYDTFLIYIFSPFLKGYLLFYLATKSNEFLFNFNSIRDLSFGVFLYHVLLIQFYIYIGINQVNLLFLFSLLSSIIISFFSSSLISWIKNKTENKLNLFLLS